MLIGKSIDFVCVHNVPSFFENGKNNPWNAIKKSVQRKLVVKIEIAIKKFTNNGGAAGN